MKELLYAIFEAANLNAYQSDLSGLCIMCMEVPNFLVNIQNNLMPSSLGTYLPNPTV